MYKEDVIKREEDDINQFYGMPRHRGELLVMAAYDSCIRKWKRSCHDTSTPLEREYKDITSGTGHGSWKRGWLYGFTDYLAKQYQLAVALFRAPGQGMHAITGTDGLHPKHLAQLFMMDDEQHTKAMHAMFGGNGITEPSLRQASPIHTGCEDPTLYSCHGASAYLLGGLVGGICPKLGVCLGCGHLCSCPPSDNPRAVFSGSKEVLNWAKVPDEFR